MTLRPILKTSTDSSDASIANALPFASCSKYQVLYSPHVHFPPTPTLTSIEITHSPSVYDRAPIVVAPNACALPERGGRFYKPHAGRPAYVSAKCLETWEQGEHGQLQDAPDAFTSRPGSSDYSGSGYVHPNVHHYPTHHTQHHSMTSTATCSPTCASTQFSYSPSPSPLSHYSDEVSLGADGSAIPHSSITTAATTYNHYYTQNHTQSSLQSVEAYPPISPSHQSSYSSVSEGYMERGLRSSPRLSASSSSSSLLSTSPPKDKSKRRKSFDRQVGFGSSFQEPTLDGCLGGF
ncbi:hypothetical protein BDN72DRAFT_839791 [Pluteus cervinus]|uniref:Uncharacterized protein n=1 Tax=Pluteus cervinus TaxID=181527 RepID=A0ACD3AX20_9AGAR|nr:hypothetical protein BDN72DRAFT_839791 [Pluteus cervinus]